ncbi:MULTISPECIES: DUF262 domain-containing protein [Sorangium]|uniref:GmrSD restriction endonucleases N-terminal domain-containing protein n=1 Tax=Sorangium cellulosum TaxID=56 RepID=A0A4P2R529_SORCE|nr:MULTISPECIES: DUF262 domain-containing protein [Sorangium]AUX38210.1 uncharacterized protein SOCE836_104500 [Sorangium cellulosum]WCQ97498.1 hypothetical protein NQZ70_10292 [Sorangium sp. Soce836]
MPARDSDHDLDFTRTTVQRLITDIREGRLCIPEFQRGYVWKPNKAADLLDSIYRGLPIGSLLVWETSESIYQRQSGKIVTQRHGGTARWLVDGQQRATTLERVHALDDEVAAEERLDIYFNVIEPGFQRANAAIRKDPRWVTLDKLWSRDFRTERSDLQEAFPDYRYAIEENIDRCRAILDYEIPMTVMRGHRYQDALDAFMRLNLKGVRLGGDDIESARIAGKHSGFVVEHVIPFMGSLKEQGFDRIHLSHLLIASAAIADPAKPHGRLGDFEPGQLRTAWKKMEKGVEAVRHMVASDLGLRGMSLLWSGALLVPPIVLCATRPARQRDAEQVLGWMALAALHHRYGAATQSTLERDLKAMAAAESPVGALVRNLRRQQSLRASADDFDRPTQDRGAMFATYVACRQRAAKCLVTRQRVEDRAAGDTFIDRHHLVPRGTFKTLDAKRASDVVANIAFILRDANQSVGKAPPSVTLRDLDAKTLRSQCIPQDSALWVDGEHVELWAARRRLLSEAFNDFVARAVEAAKE